MDNKNTDPIKENKNVRFGSSGSVSAGGTTSGEKKPSDVKNVHAVPKGEDPSVERTVNLSNQRPKRQYFARPETDELKLGVERSRIPETPSPVAEVEGVMAKESQNI